MFVGKQVILGWLNSALQLRLEKIEDVSFPLRRTLSPASVSEPPKACCTSMTACAAKSA